MGLSTLGAFHTIIGIIAIIASLISYVRFGKIDLTHITGKIYLVTTVITALTALGISKHGGFNPGHILSLLVFVLVIGAYLLSRKKKGNNRARYFENFFLTFSFFLSLLPTVNETLTRVPVGHPLAKDITDPIILHILLVLFVLFVVGSVLQVVYQRKLNNITIAGGVNR